MIKKSEENTFFFAGSRELAADQLAAEPANWALIVSRGQVRTGERGRFLFKALRICASSAPATLDCACTDHLENRGVLQRSSAFAASLEELETLSGKIAVAEGSGSKKLARSAVAQSAARILE
jgi:hypothetical protein